MFFHRFHLVSLCILSHLCLHSGDTPVNQVTSHVLSLGAHKVTISSTPENHQNMLKLHNAIMNNDQRTVFDIIFADPFIVHETPYEDNRSFLHVAAYFNRDEAVETLILAGADPYLEDNGFLTPFDLAAWLRWTETLKHFPSPPSERRPRNLHYAFHRHEHWDNKLDSSSLCDPK